MTDDQFWEWIAFSRQEFSPSRRDGNMQLQLKWMKLALRSLPTAEVDHYYQIFGKYFTAAYRWDLWGAAYVINGGCSDDSFMDFRSWLISMGREVYSAALNDPESLAGAASARGVEGIFFEEFGGVGFDLLDDSVKATRSQDCASVQPREPAGIRWREQDLPSLFPKLWRRFSAGISDA